MRLAGKTLVYKTMVCKTLAAGTILALLVPYAPAQSPKPKPKTPLKVPPYLKSALNANKKAQSAFDNFSYSHKKEYIEWITEAKTEETRNKRIETALEWMAEGKSRNWKYISK